MRFHLRCLVILMTIIFVLAIVVLCTVVAVMSANSCPVVVNYASLLITSLYCAAKYVGTKSLFSQH